MLPGKFLSEIIEYYPISFIVSGIPGLQIGSYIFTTSCSPVILESGHSIVHIIGADDYLYHIIEQVRQYYFLYMPQLQVYIKIHYLHKYQDDSPRYIW